MIRREATCERSVFSVADRPGRMFEKSQADPRRLRIRRVAAMSISVFRSLHAVLVVLTQAAKPSEAALYNPGEACDLERTLPTFDDL